MIKSNYKIRKSYFCREMRVLLLGEYSNVHWTLAQGLRKLGVDVTVVSDGDGWKCYPRDIDLSRKYGRPFSGLGYLAQLLRLLPALKGYDRVQIINPVFVQLKAEHILPIYKYLRRNNGKFSLAAFGMDRYWVLAGRSCRTFRYSDFNIGNCIRQSADIDKWINEWIEGAKGQLNTRIAMDCNDIIAGLYEYYQSYLPRFSDKTHFIPFPINTDQIKGRIRRQPTPIRFFIGIQRDRNTYKGTDIMLHALERIARDYPGRCEIVKVESVPYTQYQEMMDSCDVLLDQLYSYTPAMNGLLAMAKGLVLVGGGEPEGYDLLGDYDLRPIINVQPTEQNVYDQLQRLVLHPELIPRLSASSIAYIKRYHDYVQVAQQYLDLWTSNSFTNS